MPVSLKNNTEGARVVGDVVIAPGKAALITDDSWSTNPVIKEWVESGQLEKVKESDVEKVNSGMDVKITAAEKEALEKERAAEQAARNGTTPPPSK